MITHRRRTSSERSSAGRLGWLLRPRTLGVLIGGAAAAAAVLVAVWLVVPTGSSADCDPSRAACPASAAPSGSRPAQNLGALPAASASPSRSVAASPSHPVEAAGCAAGRCGFPTAATTGPHGVALSRHDGNISINTDGQVINGWDLHGSLDIYANNVTVSNCRIASSNWWGVNLRAGYTGLRVLHCAISGVPGKGLDNGGEDYAVSNMGSGSVEVGWNDVSQFGNALSMGHGYIHDNYVHDLAVFVNASGTYEHTDAVISDGGDTGGLTIRHNTLLNQTPVDKGASAAVGLFADTGPVSATTVDGNLLAGGAYALYGGGAGATGIVVTNNVFATRFWAGCGVYGPVAAWNAGGAGNVWANNVTSSGATVHP